MEEAGHGQHRSLRSQALEEPLGHVHLSVVHERRVLVEPVEGDDLGQLGRLDELLDHAHVSLREATVTGEEVAADWNRPNRIEIEAPGRHDVVDQLTHLVQRPLEPERPDPESPHERQDRARRLGDPMRLAEYEEIRPVERSSSDGKRCMLERQLDKRERGDGALEPGPTRLSQP